MRLPVVVVAVSLGILGLGTPSAVAHGGSLQPQPARLQMPLQSQIGHDRGDQSPPPQPPILRPPRGHQRHDLVAIRNFPL